MACLKTPHRHLHNIKMLIFHQGDFNTFQTDASQLSHSLGVISSSTASVS